MKAHLLCCLAAITFASAGEVRIEGDDANVHFLNNGCKITSSSCSALSSFSAEIDALKVSAAVQMKALKDVNEAQSKENASLRALLVALTARVAANERAHSDDAQDLVAAKQAYEAADDALQQKIAQVAKMQGPKGETGATGAKGSKGEKGERGIQGVQGAQGAQGKHGVKGDAGTAGAPGAAGAKGSKGNKGDKGVTVTSAPPKPNNIPSKEYSCGKVHAFTAAATITASATLSGGDGGSSPSDHPAVGSRGGITTATLTIAAGDKVEFIVGCKGRNGNGRSDSTRPGAGGGGGTAITINGKPVAVAGGGGGAAGCFARGGSGGGSSGNGGFATFSSKGFTTDREATPGSQSSAGTGARGDRGEPDGQNGSGHDGGHAGGHVVFDYSRAFGFGRGGGSTRRAGDCGGGGGGGGYFGGGGGAAGGHGHSGAGGSGYCADGIDCSTKIDQTRCNSIESSHGPRVSVASCTSNPVDGKIVFKVL